MNKHVGAVAAFKRLVFFEKEGRLTLKLTGRTAVEVYICIYF